MNPVKLALKVMFIVGYMVVEKCGCCFHLVFGGDDELLLPADDGEDRKQGGFAWEGEGRPLLHKRSPK